MKEYDIGLTDLEKKLANRKYKKILIQLPDGLKPNATEIADKLGEFSEVIIWGSSCFGACDLPDVKSLKFDLIFQFGHNEFR